MTSEELAAIKATLADLRKQMPLGFNDSETAVDIGDQLVAEVKRLRKALERLGSSEAFTYAMAINTDDPREEELRARLDFARDTMK